MDQQANATNSMTQESISEKNFHHQKEELQNWIGVRSYQKKPKAPPNLHSTEELAGPSWIGISDKFHLLAWELRIGSDHEDGWLIMQPSQLHQQSDPLLHGEYS